MDTLGALILLVGMISVLFWIVAYPITRIIKHRGLLGWKKYLGYLGIILVIFGASISSNSTEEKHTDNARSVESQKSNASSDEEARKKSEKDSSEKKASEKARSIEEKEKHAKEKSLKKAKSEEQAKKESKAAAASKAKSISNAQAKQKSISIEQAREKSESVVRAESKAANAYSRSVAKEQEQQEKAYSKSIAREQAQQVSIERTSNQGNVGTAQQGKVIGNSKSMIYHTADQQNYRMSSSNMVVFNSEAEAIASGYRKSQR